MAQRTATIRHCTRGPWGFSTLSGGRPHAIVMQPTICRPGPLFRDGRCRFQKGDHHGRPVVDQDEATRIGLDHGYLQPYGRNTTGFVMSRAARRRGFTTTDYLYQSRAARHQSPQHGAIA
jgi:hypothetical protein